MKKKIVLSPFVYLKKGAIRWAFYDLFTGKLFQVIPEGSLEKFTKKAIRDAEIFWRRRYDPHYRDWVTELYRDPLDPYRKTF